MNLNNSECPSQPASAGVASPDLPDLPYVTASAPRPPTHALCVPLGRDGEIASLEENAERLVGQLAAAAGAPPPAGGARCLWRHDVPAAHDSHLAGLLRAAEMRRPLANAQVRLVLLRYADGAADLVLVARRTLLTAWAMRRLADSLLGRSDPAVAPWTAALAPGRQAMPTIRVAGEGEPPFDWAQSRANAGLQARRLRCPIDTAADGALQLGRVIAAVNLVLARYNQQARHDIAVQVDSVAQARAGSTDGPVVLGIDAGAADVAELLRTSEEMADVLLSGTGDQLARLATPPQDAALVSVQLTFLEQADAPVHYLPCQHHVYPIELVFVSGPSSHLDCVTREGVFDPQVIEQFARSVANVYATLPLQPQLRPAQVALLPPAVPAGWEGQRSRQAASSERRIDRAFAAIAARQGERTALSCDDVSLSYAELEQDAAVVARGLRHHGAGPGRRVGICLERSIDAVVMMLAVLKAGATYVPMDPQYPAERLAHTASDAALAVVITTMPAFPATDAVLVTPAGLRRLGSEAAAGPIEQGSGDDPAYVIYTSGSTGRPKGVVVPHDNVISLLDATRADFQLGSADTWTLFHSSAFDFSVWEIWGCLLTGGHLVVVPYWVSRSPDEFYDLLCARNVTVLNQTPSAFAQLIDVDRVRSTRVTRLRLVIFGGEVLLPRMLLPWFDRHAESECRLVNMFGITETTVHVTAETIGRGEALAGTRSVGRPLPGWHVYIMDPLGNRLPTGVAGEIHVGGAGVAQQYLGRPDLTAQRFLPDPYAAGRMYRSGDKGRLRPDGRLEHLGRLDSQVKLRGFRIELDEIRAVLLEMPSVSAAAVVLRHDGANDPASARLDAFVVTDGSAAGDLRQQLAAILPEYMVPAAVIRVDALPLTANGKLDLARLPLRSVEPAPRPIQAAAPAAAAPGTLESDLIALWSTTLGVDVGIDDNFFALGGNSLLAVRLAAAMRERQLPALSMRDLYVCQTVRKLATMFEKQRAAA